MAKTSDFSGRIERGDREALAALVLQHQSRMLRRIRGKLRAAAVTVIDAEDVFSTCARRLDLMCMERRLVGMDEDELTGFIFRTLMNITTDKIRAECSRRLTLQRLWRESLREAEGSLAEPDQRMIDSLMCQLDDNDREMLQLRLDGLTHAQIANTLDISISAERSRWQRLRVKAKALLAPPRKSKSEMHDGERRAALRTIASSSSTSWLPLCDDSFLSRSTINIPSATSESSASRCEPRG